jgi:hypothetical protein
LLVLGGQAIRNAYFAAAMALVLVVTMSGPVAAQEPDENAALRAEATLPAVQRVTFDVTPGMARMLGQSARLRT